MPSCGRFQDSDPAACVRMHCSWLLRTSFWTVLAFRLGEHLVRAASTVFLLRSAHCSDYLALPITKIGPSGLRRRVSCSGAVLSLGGQMALWNPLPPPLSSSWQQEPRASGSPSVAAGSSPGVKRRGLFLPKGDLPCTWDATETSRGASQADCLKMPLLGLQ